MYIITYGKRNLTFKAETMKEAEKVLRRCEVDQGQLSPDSPEPPPRLMTEEEYLDAENLDSLDDIEFDDPNYL